MTDFPSLVADIGGTHARFGLVGTDRSVYNIQTLKGEDHASPQAAALAYLDGQTIKSATLAVAAPIDLTPIKFTNSPWRVDKADLAQALKLQPKKLHLLNDFEALALSLAHLTPAQLQPIGSGKTRPHHTKAVLGPGTGLGVAGCIPNGKNWLALATEGGHATLCAINHFEAELLHALRAQYPHISAERLLSGTGLPTLYAAVCQVTNAPHHPFTAEQITQQALALADTACQTTLDTFCAMLGTFAGNVALTLGARGGVYLGGGISQALAATLGASQFRERFEAKGRYRAYLADIQTQVITAPHAALIGAATALRIW
jgi:glucokinase